MSSLLGVTISITVVAREAIATTKIGRGRNNSLLTKRQERKHAIKQPTLPSKVLPSINGLFPKWVPQRAAQASPRINMIMAITPSGSGKRVAKADPAKNIVVEERCSASCALPTRAKRDFTYSFTCGLRNLRNSTKTARAAKAKSALRYVA